MIKQFCLWQHISLDPNSPTVISLEEYSLLHTSMGHLVSKHKRTDLNSVPQGRFSITEEVSRQYPSQEEGTVGPIQASGTSHESSISMEWEAPRQASEPQNSRKDCQRQSIYSAMDAVPHLEFYTNSIGRQRHSRPSLEVLRNVSEVTSVFSDWPKIRLIGPDLHSLHLELHS